MNDHPYVKSKFVLGRLKDLCQSIDHDIVDMKYDCYNVSDREEVTIIYRAGFDKCVNVTGDSLKGIACDVIERL